MKAILELENMPDSCSACPLSKYSLNKKIWTCAAYKYGINITDEVDKHRKSTGCPLKEVEDK